MQRLEAFNKATVVFAAAIAGAFAPLLSDALKPMFGESMAGACIFTLVIFGLSVLQLMIDHLINSSRSLRRFLLGHGFVEGYWIDYSRDPNNKVVGAACVYIFYHEGRLEISGTTLKSDNGMYASWDVKFATMQNRTLAYSFESHTNRAETPVEIGYAEMKFCHGSGEPMSYSGFFFDTTTNRTLEAVLKPITVI